MKSFFSLGLVLIIIAPILMFANSVLAQVWSDQFTGISSAIRPVKAVDENTVWAGANDGIYLRTTNGGMNWTWGKLPGIGSVNLLSIAAIDSDTAYFSGASWSEYDTRIYKTTDGGQSWEMQYKNTNSGAFIRSIAFWDETHGIAVGDPVDGSFVVLTTTNGGANWNQIPAGNIQAPLTEELAGISGQGGTGLALAGANHAWFGTAYASRANQPIRIFKSTDQGQTWTLALTALAKGGSYGVTSMAFQDTLNGFAGSVTNYATTTTNTLVTTTDGGQTWPLVTTFVQTPAHVRTLVYVPGTAFQTLVASTAAGTVLSHDGGTTWTSLSSDDFIGMSFVSPTVGWAGGLDGRIAKFSGNLPTGILEQISETPRSFSLSQNYPNPFNPSTTIQFAIAKRAAVKLSVFDILGREVAILVDEVLRPGMYNKLFETSGLPSGVYVYRIETGEFVQTKKLMILK